MQSGITWKGLAIFCASVGLAGLWIGNMPSDNGAVFPLPHGRTLVNECGGCHTVYAPGLLPARSWRKMLAELDKHFGKDVSVLEPVRLALLKDLEDMAADGAFADLRLRRIAGAVPVDAMPLRITETRYFKFLHDEVPPRYWRHKAIASAANCVACHPRANEGRYGEREIQLPQQEAR
ncbi:MAG: diheme cytochrome c [Pseudomonadota bacterium]|nr:diheme cytochrome c [Pseudomonadota bacterium]